jgi:hypothetical protein
MTHTCHRRGCDTAVPPRMFMCPPDWSQLPRPLQGAVWAAYRPGQEITKDPSPAYLAAAHRAIEYLGEAEQPSGLESGDHRPAPVTDLAGLPAPVGRSQDGEPRRPPRRSPDNPCPGCQTAELTYGRQICQACAVLGVPVPSAGREFRDLSHGHPGHMCVLPANDAEAGQ